jgi:hypothetical protein
MSTWPPHELLDVMAYHWLHAERAGGAAIAQWVPDERAWACISEARSITPQEMHRRGWEYLGPVEGRPRSEYLDAAWGRTDAQR